MSQKFVSPRVLIYNTYIQRTFIDDYERHILGNQSAGMTNINGSFLLITSQYPYIYSRLYQ